MAGSATISTTASCVAENTIVSSDLFGFSALALIPLIPLLGAVLIGVGSKYIPPVAKLAPWIASVMSALTFCVVLQCFSAIAGCVDSKAPVLSFKFWNWISSGDLNLSLSLQMDKLSGVMSLVITGIGTLIHVYAIGYMAKDKSKPRFFCYLNLFLFAMLIFCLLYTSPSPRDATLSRMPSSA